MKKRQQFYSDAFKLAVIEDVLSGRMSKEHAQKEYGILGKSAILQWMRTFGLSEETELSDPYLAMKEKIQTDTEELKKRIKELERALAHASLKAEAFSKMIDIAEREYKIPVRKNFGTKQSGK